MLQQQQQQQTPVAVSTVHITAAQSPAHPSILPAVMRIAQERFARPSSRSPSQRNQNHLISSPAKRDISEDEDS